jgi:hypothetical protein
MRCAPLQSTIAVHKATVTATTGDNSDFGRKLVFFNLFAVEGFNHLHRLKSLLNYGDDLRLFLANVVRSFFNGLLESRDEEEKEWRHCEGDEGEIPVEPEHQAQHAQNGEHVDNDVEGRR